MNSVHARVLAKQQGQLKKNQRMLNSFLSLDINPNPVAAEKAKQAGISTPQWNLRKISD